MRRTDRELPREEAVSVLEGCEYGVLSLVTKENAPYSVPISYVYEDGVIYMHCAKEGEKLDCIKSNPKARFTAVGLVRLVQGDFSTLYESAIADGIASLVDDADEKRSALLKLCEKYYPETGTNADDRNKAKMYIDERLPRTAVVKIDVTSVTGKAHK